MTDVWVCTNCKSINRQRDSRCYSCGKRQEDVAAVSTEAPNVRLVEAAAHRTVRGYAPSWPFAVAAGVLIVVVAVMGLWLVVESVRSVGALREAFLTALQTEDTSGLDRLLVQQQQLASPSLMRFGLLVLAVIAFGLWLSRVCQNIPALGGGEPRWSPVKALVYPLIPIVNLVKVPGMVQDALYRLDPRAGGFFMVLLAWIGFVGSWLVSVIGSFVIAGVFVGAIAGRPERDEVAAAFGALLDQTLVLTVITELMTAAGALLLVAIIARIESRSMARDREIREAVLGPGGGDPAATPLWSPDEAPRTPAGEGSLPPPPPGR